jgi:uncharacterized ion transporter superfamily protein YfcC
MVKKVPDALVIISVILLIFIGLTWIVPAGKFERAEINGRQAVVPGTFEYVDQQPQSPLIFFSAPIKGFIAAAEIIGFVLLIGGAFYVITATGAVTAGLQSLIRFSQNYPHLKNLIIPLLMVLFSLGGCTFGMAEEVLVFVLITIPMAAALKYDSIVGVAIPFVGAGAGFAGAAFNPFTVGIAQGIAEIPIFSGWEYRMIVWAILTGISIIFVMIYAKKVERNPQKSLMYNVTPETETVAEPGITKEVQMPFTAGRKWILITFLFSLVLLVVGVNVWDWYIEEIAGLFIGISLVAALIHRLPVKNFIKAFTEGAREMVIVALIIAMSRAILVVAEQGNIIDTMLFAVSNASEGLPNYVSVQIMLYVQTFINVFIPSGSGQAALTMPVMAPLSDLIGITRQTAVLAYQLGDGLTNLIIPTSGITMGILALAGVPYNVWIKWIWKLMVVLYLAAMVALFIPAVGIVW